MHTMTPKEVVNLCSPSDNMHGISRPAKRPRSASEPRQTCSSWGQEIIDLSAEPSAEENTSASRGRFAQPDSTKGQQAVVLGSRLRPAAWEQKEHRVKLTSKPVVATRPGSGMHLGPKDGLQRTDVKAFGVGNANALLCAESARGTPFASSIQHVTSMHDSQTASRGEILNNASVHSARTYRVAPGRQSNRNDRPVDDLLAASLETAMSDEFLACRLQEQEDEELAKREQQILDQSARLQATLEALRPETQTLHEQLLDRHSTLPRRSRNLRQHGAQRTNWGASLTALLPLPLPTPTYRNPSWTSDHFSAVHQAMLGMARSGLPPQLLFSDRDFTAEDYDWLCRLDETVENKKGASQREIDSCPTQIVTRGSVPSDTGDVASCSICMEDFAEGNVLRSLPCAHRFHRDCVDKWLKQKATCPICQRECR